jgi:hypothetical protein
MSRKPSWRKLYIIGALACVGLVWESNLRASEDAHHILLIFWVIVVYSAIIVWMMRNDSAIARQMPPAKPVRVIDEFLDADRVALQQSGDVETQEGKSHV